MPILEYAWDPHTQKGIRDKQADLLQTDLWFTSVTNLISNLGWESLQAS